MFGLTIQVSFNYLLSASAEICMCCLGSGSSRGRKYIQQSEAHHSVVTLLLTSKAALPPWNYCLQQLLPPRAVTRRQHLPCHIPFMAFNRPQGGHSLSDGVLEPDPELCTRGGLQEGWPPVSSSPKALCEWQVQLPERILGDQLPQGFGEEPIMRN